MDSKDAKINHVVLFGASGLLGKEFQRVLSARGYDVLGPSHGQVDISDLDSLTRFFAEGSEPIAVINAAALISVDEIEKNPAQAEK